MRLLVKLVSIFCLSASLAYAGEVAKFNQEFDGLNISYRQIVASFQQDKKELKIKAAENFAKKLDVLINNYKKPPPHFSEEKEWNETWVQVKSMADQALGLLQKNSTDNARTVFEDLRELLANLRKRNNIIIHEDFIFAYYGRMDELVGSDFTPKSLGDDPKRIIELKEQLAVLSYLLEAMENNAPDKLSNDTKFLMSLEELSQSIEKVRQAIETKDNSKIAAEVLNLRPTFMKFFLKHG